MGIIHHIISYYRFIYITITSDSILKCLYVYIKSKYTLHKGTISDLICTKSKHRGILVVIFPSPQLLAAWRQLWQTPPPPTNSRSPSSHQSYWKHQDMQFHLEKELVATSLKLRDFDTSGFLKNKFQLHSLIFRQQKP